MEFKTEKITKEDFMKLKEDDLMFITNPGRMGDEDGSTFIIKNGDSYKIYRVDGWMYSSNRDENFISMNDMFNLFPKWKETWENHSNEDYEGKYKYIYMGFGNGLCIDKRIYNEFYPYLLEEVKNNEHYFLDENNNYSPSLNYSAWRKAFVNMINKSK